MTERRDVDPANHGAGAAGATVARVVLVPPSGRLGELDYRIPPSLRGLQAGARVVVPLGTRRCMGVVTAVADRATLKDVRLRDVIDTLDAEPILAGALLRLAMWMAEYYIATPGDALATALPGVLRIETEKVAERIDGGIAAPRASKFDELDAAILEMLQSAGAQPVTALRERLGEEAEAAIRRLQRRRWVRISERFVREVAPTRYELSYSATAGDTAALNRRPALRAIHEYLRGHPQGRAAIRELRGSFANPSAKVRQLRDLGLVREHRREVYRTVAEEQPLDDRRVSLNAAQSAAVERIVTALGDGFQSFLLLGVTGSGKTEVYLRVIAEVLERGRNVLILVPEISLTHQVVGRVRARLAGSGIDVAVLHSGLGPGERWDEWRRLARGEARIAIGARSAVFAPLPNLGVIIVDEEHDGAYKQADGLRYHGRDVAVMRAKLENCPLVLGSATASMESLHNARMDRYALLELPDRVESRALPDVELLDLRGRSMQSPLSPPLAAAIEANFAAGGQTLLFLNRRGFANALQCRACGDTVSCPNCSISLTWHQRDAALRCHYCDFARVRPPRCEVCGEAALDTWGWGTERLESFLRETLPGARIARMDRDTTGRKGSLASLLHAWNTAKLDVLIGTQMVTKGHDVAGVTLVGVVMADLVLHLPDFRSAEKAFQQLVQVAGRAGRGDRPGRVLIQTLQPEHHVLQAVVTHDFVGFAEQELNQREELGYPPFGRLVLVRFEGGDMQAVKAAAEQCASRLRQSAQSGTRGVAVLGPAPAPLARLRGRHRWQILLRGKSGATLRRLAIDATQSRAKRPGDLRILVDVDPQSLL